MLWLSIIDFKHTSWGCSLTCCTFEITEIPNPLLNTTHSLLKQDTHIHTYSSSHTYTRPTEFLPCRAVYRWNQRALCRETKRKRWLNLLLGRFHTYSTVCLLWSQSVDKIVNLERFPLGSVTFHTEKIQAKQIASLQTTWERSLCFFFFFLDASETGARK